VITDLRLRIVMLVALLGIASAAAGYLYGAPVVVALLPPAMALVAAVRLAVGRLSTYLAAGLATAAFVFLQLAGTEQLHVSLGTGAVDLTALLHSAGGLQTFVGVAGVMAAVLVAELVARGLEAREGERATAITSAAPTATVIRISVGAKPDGRRGQRISGDRLAELVSTELQQLKGATILDGGRKGEVIVLLSGAADERANQLLRRLEALALEQLERSLESSVIVLEGHAVDRDESQHGSGAQLIGRPVETPQKSTAGGNT
jgi:hypothetical protein